MTELEKVTRELEATRAARDELLRANAALSSTAHEAGKALTEALNTVAECENEAQWQERERKRLAGAVGRFVQEAIKVPSADRAYLVIVMPEEHFREELDKARQRAPTSRPLAIFGDEFSPTFASSRPSRSIRSSRLTRSPAGCSPCSRPEA